jgi:hypothetical protein
LRKEKMDQKMMDSMMVALLAKEVELHHLALI